MSNNNNWNVVFWDLDGTITDPRKGIVGAYQKLLAHYDQPPQIEEELLWVIGPALRACIKQIIPVIKSDKQVEEAVSKYREFYVKEGLMYLDTPYLGIEDILKNLKSRKIRMMVATAKAHPYARQILDHWELSKYFEEIHGSELDGTRANKAELIKWMLEKYNILGSSKTLMIGDREHDIIAAKANHLSTVGVGYGYGSENELRSANADFFCPDVRSLSSLLLSC